MARERLLYVADVAEMLNRSIPSINWMIHAGTGPRSAKIGGRRMFKESDVLAWIEEQFEAEQKAS